MPLFVQWIRFVIQFTWMLLPLVSPLFALCTSKWKQNTQQHSSMFFHYFTICCWCFNFCLLLLSIHLIHSTLDVLLLLPMPHASHLFLDFRRRCNISSFIHVSYTMALPGRTSYTVLPVSCWPKRKRLRELSFLRSLFAYLERSFFIL